MLCLSSWSDLETKLWDMVYSLHLWREQTNQPTPWDLFEVNMSLRRWEKRRHESVPSRPSSSSKRFDFFFPPLFNPSFDSRRAMYASSLASRAVFFAGGSVVTDFEGATGLIALAGTDFCGVTLSGLVTFSESVWRGLLDWGESEGWSSAGRFLRLGAREKYSAFFCFCAARSNFRDSLRELLAWERGLLG